MYQPLNKRFIMYLAAMYLPLNKLFIVWLSHWLNCWLCISQRCIYHWINCLLLGSATEQQFIMYLAAMYLPLNKLLIVWFRHLANCLLCISQRWPSSCVYHWTTCLLCVSATERTVYYVSRSDVSTIDKKLFICGSATERTVYYVYCSDASTIEQTVYCVAQPLKKNCLLCISQRCIFHWTNCFLCGLATEQTVYYTSRSDVFTTEQTVYYIFRSDVSTIEQVVYFVAQPLNNLFSKYLTAMYLLFNTLFILRLRHWANCTLCISQRCINHWTNS